MQPCHRQLATREDAEQVLLDAENDQIDQLKTLSNNGRGRYGPAHATVVDHGNLQHGQPRIFTGRNLGQAFDPDDLHPTLKRRRDAYLADVTAMSHRRVFPNGVPVDGDPRHHAEAQATNAALFARQQAGLPDDDAALEEILVSVRRIDRKPSGPGRSLAAATTTCGFSPAQAVGQRWISPTNSGQPMTSPKENASHDRRTPSR